MASFARSDSHRAAWTSLSASPGVTDEEPDAAHIPIRRLEPAENIGGPIGKRGREDRIEAIHRASRPSFRRHHQYAPDHERPPALPASDARRQAALLVHGRK